MDRFEVWASVARDQLARGAGSNDAALVAAQMADHFAAYERRGSAASCLPQRDEPVNDEDALEADPLGLDLPLAPPHGPGLEVGPAGMFGFLTEEGREGLRLSLDRWDEGWPDQGDRPFGDWQMIRGLGPQERAELRRVVGGETPKRIYPSAQEIGGWASELADGGTVYEGRCLASHDDEGGVGRAFYVRREGAEVWRGANPKVAACNLAEAVTESRRAEAAKDAPIPVPPAPFPSGPLPEPEEPAR